jgi:hypothetical protein
MVRKVTGIWDEGTVRTTAIVRPPAGFGSHTIDQRSSSQLAARLAPPSAPAKIKPSQVQFAFVFLPLLALIAVISEAVQTPPRVPLVLAVAIAATCAVVIVIAGKANEGSLAEVRRANEGNAARYEQDLARWKQSYYCAKCDFVFSQSG